MWSDGYYANTVSKHGNEKVVAKYVKEQGKDYHLLHETKIATSPFSNPNTPPQAAALFILASTDTHFIVDITGYYAP